MCKRYPGRRPSDYLGIEDEYTAFHLDMALALKGENKDNKAKMDMLEILRNDLVTVAKSLGGKIKLKKKPESNPKMMDGEKVPTVREALAMLGGKGTAIIYNKKDKK